MFVVFTHKEHHAVLLFYLFCQIYFFMTNGMVAKKAQSVQSPKIHCSPERNITHDQLSAIASFNFIHKPQNILITGATGSGKSYLACAIGRQACHLGYKTLYLNMNRFIEKVATSKLDGTYVKLLNQIERIPLLILDDFGLQPLDQTQRLTLLQILEDRYAKKPTIVASQLPVSKWHNYLADPTIADAILDRLTANSNRLDLKGKSMRQNQPE
jgi:DNA replication protein DnaC